jgi:hypothetical protein
MEDIDIRMVNFNEFFKGRVIFFIIITIMKKVIWLLLLIAIQAGILKRIDDR